MYLANCFVQPFIDFDKPKKRYVNVNVYNHYV